MKSILSLFILVLLLSGCAGGRQTLVRKTVQGQVMIPQLPSYQEEIYWVPASHKEALVNRKTNEDGSVDEPHIRKIRFKDGDWGSKEELIKRLREEYGDILEIKEKTKSQPASRDVQEQDKWPFEDLSGAGK